MLHTREGLLRTLAIGQVEKTLHQCTAGTVAAEIGASPCCACYKRSWLAFQIAKRECRRLVRLPERVGPLNDASQAVLVQRSGAIGLLRE